MGKLTSSKGTWAAVFATVILLAWPVGQAVSESDKAYVGSEACGDCHEGEYEKFQKYAKKAHTFEKIKVMKKGLTDAEFQSCFECHTTGYGKPGGFKSESETPGLKDAGCEVCHGPGSLHVESEDPEDIFGSLDPEGCESCHSADRVAAFDYKPLIYGGAH